MVTANSLQMTYAPKSICFGCGPANTQGLHIASFVEREEVIAHWQPQKFHEAFPGVLNGGIIGTLLDCHCNWAAAWHLMQHMNLDKVPCTVTSEYQIKMPRPTPAESSLLLKAKKVEIIGNSAIISGTITVNDKVCAFCVGTFVVVKEGHPAFHRW